MIYSDAIETVREQVKALEVLEGYPLAPVYVHPGARHLVPVEFKPGAPGWTTRMVEVIDDGQGKAEVELPLEVVERHRGKVVDLGGKPVIIDVKEASADPVTDDGVKEDGSILTRLKDWLKT